MIPCSLMDQEERRGGVGQDGLQARLGTFCGDAARDACRAQASRALRHGPKDFVPCACATWLCPRAAGHVVPTWSAQSPTGHSWPPPHTGSGPDDAWRGAASVAMPLSARPGGGPRQDDPTPRALSAPQTPRCAATYTHHGGWRARRTRASSGPGGGPSPGTH
jgi:hypothetical protein